MKTEVGCNVARIPLATFGSVDREGVTTAVLGTVIPGFDVWSEGYISSDVMSIVLDVIPIEIVIFC